MSYPRFYPTGYGYHCIGWFRDGRYYARPEEEVVMAFLFICGAAAKKYGIGIVAWALMASHPHLFVFDKDPNGPSRVSCFKKYVHSCFAMWLNAYRGTKGKVIDPNVLSQQFAIVDVRGELDTVSYIENNWLSAGVLDLDGVIDKATSSREFLLEPLVIERPDFWFQPRTWDDVVEIQLEVPPMAAGEGHTRESWYTRSSIECYLAQMETWERLIEEGHTPGSMKTPAEVLAEDPLLVRKSKVNHSLVQCAGSDRAKKARFYRARRVHRRMYFRCKDALKSGRRDVIFPWGTCRVAVSYGYEVRAAPPD